MTVVFTPCFFGAAFTSESGLKVLELWRDGFVRPAVDRHLLVRYFKLWRTFGFSEALMRRWGWWLTSPKTAMYLPGDLGPIPAFATHIDRVGRQAEAEFVVHGGVLPRPAIADEAGPREGGSVTNRMTWITPDEFLDRMAARGSG